MAIITLTTDFGTSDGYVGAMKGVIAHDAPNATIVDLAHDVPRHDIAHAAWIVRTACTRFAAGTIHVVVVDPGVGGARRAVVVRAQDMYFIGPDNGVFAYLGKQVGRELAVSATAAPTFHGRDVFAPAAARIACGLDIETLPSIELRGALAWPAGEGRIVHVDHFGNLISDLLPCAAVAIAGKRLPVVRTYEDVAPGELLAYVGSAGTIEIGVRDGSAARVLGVQRGEQVMPAGEGGVYR